MIIWLSSYPKSGNTWVRSIISSILYSQDGIHSFKNMEMIEQYPIRKQFTGLISNFHSINEIKKNWISSQERINIDGKIKFFKTHHVNCTIDNDPFTNNSNTTGVIYIVRDPRNVITSLKYHFSIENYDIAKKMLFYNDQAIGNKLNNNSTKNIVRAFLNMIKNTPEIKSKDLDEDQKTKMMSLSGVKQYPMRVKCATLAWHTLTSAMDGKKKEVNTESITQ